MKSLKEIALQIDEPTYRKMPELSYSILSRFQSVGFDIDKLQESVSSPSVTFGSAVDTIITGGQDEFDRNFMVVDLPNIPESASNCVRIIWNKYKDTYKHLNEIPIDTLNTELYTQILQAVNTLKTSSATKDYFAEDNPWDNSIERLYQLKFRAELNGIGYKCMFD